MKLNGKKVLVLFVHAFIIWALCGAVIAVGRPLLGTPHTLIVHLIAAPIFACVVSYFYYKKFGYTTPLQTSIIFVFIIIAMDGGIVAPFFEKSYSMFRSAIGTWIPFALIFLATYMTGKRQSILSSKF